MSLRNKSLILELSSVLGLMVLSTWSLKRGFAKISHSDTLLSTSLGLAAMGWIFRSKKMHLPASDISAVITGGSRGLGLAMANELLSRGARVTLLARNSKELDRARMRLASFHSRVHSIPCDVTDPHAINEAFAQIRARFGSIDFLINNAGAISVGPFDAMEDSDFEASWRIHALAVVRTTRAVLPYFRQIGGGRILNICSIGGQVPVPHLSSYAAGKFALSGLSETLAAELSVCNVSITTAYPGLMRTGSPIQAVFKGDHEAEFEWFSASDQLPLISIPADVAARKLIDAAMERRSRVVLTVPAWIAIKAHALFPEITAVVNAWIARALPRGKSQERLTGAVSRSKLQPSPWRKYLTRKSVRLERKWNQSGHDRATFNLGLSPEV